jgi:hypothetical protein
MNQDKTVTAAFTTGSPPPPTTETLTVIVQGTGTGTVAEMGAQNNINCGTGGSICSHNYPSGTQVTLVINAGNVAVIGSVTGCQVISSYYINGEEVWDCVVTMNQNTTVTVRFDYGG